MIPDKHAEDLTLDFPIPRDLVLWRRVHKDSVVEDVDTSGAKTLRPSSTCFDDNSKGSMSVYDSECCGGVERILAGHPDFGVASITAGLLEDGGQILVRTADGGPGHLEVRGKKTQGKRKNFAKSAIWVVKPPPKDQN
jgi:hypothetical protein